MNTNRYNQRARGSINPTQRGSGIKIPSRVNLPQTPLVIQEYITKNVTIFSGCGSCSSTSFDMVMPNRPMVTIQPTNPRLNKYLARTTNKAMLLSRLIMSKQEEKEEEKQPKAVWISGLVIRRMALALVLVLLLGSTGYVSVNTWQTNIQAKQAIAAITPSIEKETTVNKSVDTSASKTPQSVEGNKAVLSNLDGYSVAADSPRAIYINKIGVEARIIPMGLNSDNSLQAPTDVNEAGWYSASAKPGQPGAMLIDGHASETGTNYGLFGYLLNLKLGDQITIERGDGVKLNYSVANTEIVPLESIDMSKTLVPYNGAEQGVNLIACTGQWTADGSTLDHRLIVYAVLQN